MVYLIAFLILVCVMAATWFTGFWGATLTFVNIVFSAMIASNFFEPVADAINNSLPRATYLLDFLSLWGLFFISFGIFRAFTAGMSRFQVKFVFWMETMGQSIMAVSCALVFLSFTMFTLHTAPLGPAPFNSFQQDPDSINLVYGPDRLWLGFLQSRSRGGFAEFRNHPIAYQGEDHPEDEGKNIRPFDSTADFIFKYRARRQSLSQQKSLIVN